MSRSKFAEEIDQLFKAENRIAEGDIQIWGGKIKEDGLQQFFSKWGQLDMPFVILETVSEITIRKNFDCSMLDPYIVDRIRIFGEGGDLDIRRDTVSFMWRYIGKTILHDGLKSDKENFWEKNPGKTFFMEEKEALLWGKYKQEGLWHDNRVAKANLSYPVEGHPEAVKVRYKTMSDHGVIAFTWLLTIEGEVRK